MQQPPSGQNWPPQQVQGPYGYGQPSQPLPPNAQWGQQPYPPQQQWPQPPSQPLPPNAQWGQQSDQSQSSWPIQPQHNYPFAHQPPLKKKRVQFFVLLVLIVIIAGSFIGGFILLSNHPALPSASSTALGQPISLFEWTVTINKVTTSTGNGVVATQQSGDIFLVITVTLQNNSSGIEIASSTTQFNLTDSTGQTYNQVLAFSGSPNGELLEGSSIHGTLYYEVPETNHDYTLRFVPDLLDDSVLALWAITLS